MRAIKIFLGIIIGLIAGILGFIALGSVLSSFSLPTPAEIYRHAPEKSLIGYFVIFTNYPAQPLKKRQRVSARSPPAPF